ncbi:hypothetical protein [Mailhella massiliensis]|uniref:hypothetical protein n=1 Tax=Mailhella massiliensis TaxID=1903261 RepID=UPI00097D3C4B|nr:hypothetical protein [Mailhella massiliensis]
MQKNTDYSWQNNSKGEYHNSEEYKRKMQADDFAKVERLREYGEQVKNNNPANPYSQPAYKHDWEK